MPSARALAVEFGVSRTTVTSAYEQLAAEGLATIRQGARPRVAVDTMARDNDQLRPAPEGPVKRSEELTPAAN